MTETEDVILKARYAIQYKELFDDTSPVCLSPHIRQLAENTQEVKIVVLILKLMANYK